MTITALIFSLPNELLVSVAAAGQEGRVADLKTALHSKSEWTLSHLSRHFRDVVIHAPSLWTLIEVNLSSKGSVEISKLYFQRSRALNVSATLQSLPEGYPDSDLHLVSERLEQIRFYINRIWRLRIRLRTGSGEMLLSPFRSIAAPNLRHLELINEPGDPRLLSMFDSGRPDIFLSGAPMLTFFKICGFTVGQSPWAATLTRLELGRTKERDAGVFDSLVEHCSSLVHLYIDMSWSKPQRRFHIPTLKSLHISVAGEEDDTSEFYLVDLVHLFDAPQLTEFTIDGTHGEHIWVLLNSTSLHTSFPALTSLYFVSNGSCVCEEESESSIFSSPPRQLFPAVSSLTLIDQCFTADLVTNVLSSASQHWPLLKTLTLCPKEHSFLLAEVGDALRDCAALLSGAEAPKLRLSRGLLSLMDGGE
ncbi:hypothetical protein DFH06DRAFT_1176839, partial [Mycena polygramma]